MAIKGKEYKLAVRIAGVVDRSYDASLLKASSKLRSLQANINAIDSQFVMMDKGFNSIMGVGKKAFGAISRVARTAAIAIAPAAAAGVKLATDFEAEMSTVQSISGATVDELAMLTEQARNVAKNTVFSATETAKAMEYMGMAGWKTEQIMSGLDGVVSLAAASGEDLALVSDIVTDSLTAMGKSAEDSGHFSDVLAQAAMNSNTTVEQLGHAFKYAAPMAGSLGYGIEDLTIALGTMASSGIKASLAGTTMRNIMTRMVKPTKESQQAMDALNLSLADEKGEMYSLMEIMQNIRKAFGSGGDMEAKKGALTTLAGLTDDQIEEVKEDLGELSKTEEAFYAAELGGARGISGLLAIANTSEADFNKLSTAIYNSEGAAEEMSKIRLNNLQGDLHLMKDAAEDMGIEFYFQFNNQIRGAVQNLTKTILSMTKTVPANFTKMSSAFNSFKRHFTRDAKPIIDLIKGSFGWVKDNGDSIVNVIAGIGGALVSYKIMSTMSHIAKSVVTFASALTPVGGVILGITAAVGALTAAYVGYKRQERKLIDKNLAEHFGNIALSMADVQAVAESLVKSDAIKSIESAMGELEKLTDIEQDIQGSVDDLNKLNWKVKVGFDLDEGEQSDYKAAIEEYIKGVQDYAVQGHYAVSLNLANYFDENDNAVQTINDFYSNKEAELSDLGTQLSDYINTAFEDNLFTFDEAKKVQELQNSISNIQKDLALSRYDATLDVISSKYGGALTPETFQNLQDEMKPVLDETIKAIDESEISAIAALNAAYSDKTSPEYLNAVDKVKQTAENERAGATLRPVQFMLNTITEQYSDEMAEHEKAIQSAIDATKDYDEWILNGGQYGALQWTELMDTIAETGPTEDAKKAIEELLEGLEPYNEDIDALLADESSLSDERKKELEWIKATSDELRGLTSRRGFFGSANGDFNALSRNVESKVLSGKNSNIKTFVNNRASFEDVVAYHAKGGVVSRPELSVIGEAGPEAIIPLDSSARAKSLYALTGQLLGMSPLSDRYDLSGGSNAVVSYAPTLQFYGGTPNRNDIDDALEMSQNKFNEMMNNYLSRQRRLAF